MTNKRLTIKEALDRAADPFLQAEDFVQAGRERQARLDREWPQRMRERARTIAGQLAVQPGSAPMPGETG